VFHARGTAAEYSTRAVCPVRRLVLKKEQ
jgi:hypothetical protein